VKGKLPEILILILIDSLWSIIHSEKVINSSKIEKEGFGGWK